MIDDDDVRLLAENAVEISTGLDVGKALEAIVAADSAVEFTEGPRARLRERLVEAACALWQFELQHGSEVWDEHDWTLLCDALAEQVASGAEVDFEAALAAERGGTASE